MNDDQLSLTLKALSSPSRLRIIRLLGDRHYCVNALTARLAISQPAVSQHLAVLKDAGLVTDERCGTTVHYVLNRARLDELRLALGDMAGVARRAAAEPARGARARS